MKNNILLDKKKEPGIKLNCVMKMQFLIEKVHNKYKIKNS